MPPLVTDAQRRARLVERHRLDRTAESVDDLVQSLFALHSSDPISPFLSTWARVSGFTRDDLEQALYRQRSLWRLHAMRRTLFVVRRDDAALFDGAVGRAIADRERARLHGWLRTGGSDEAARRRLSTLEEALMAELSDGRPRRTTELSQAVPGLQEAITVGSGKWSGKTPVSSRLLLVLAMDLKIVRAEPAGTWRSSQYHWATADAWFDEPVEDLDPDAARDQLLTRYLMRFGPATSLDIRWWTGWTARRTTAAVESTGAEPVELEDGSTGWVVAGDVQFPSRQKSSVTLLPGLDSTPMGWKERSWFLGGHKAPLFDRNGNIGPTIWVDGRIVGGWGQRPGGEVATQLLEPVSDPAEKAVSSRAAELTKWLEGATATPRFPTPLQKELGTGRW
ncbi:MAG: winged helix DNA-binding domain-containing protein [Acidimicrobiales bacterium]|nr:winged helix DNA-binding domain-containing protein [Acidimicrobiales bacterium]